MKRLIFLLFISASYFSYATQTTALSTGDWSDAIWSNGEPGCIDTIIVPASVTVTISSTVDLEACTDSIIIFVYGTIDFQNGKKLKLPCDSDVLVFDGGSIGVGGGGGASTYIEMCSTEYWNAGSGDLTGPVKLCDGGCPPSQLPIELLTFEATMNEITRHVDLHWVTVSEADNDFFTIQRSSDASDWTEIMEVDGAGTSSITLNYFEEDSKPLVGDSYYRLKQTDFNGVYSYSPIVQVSSGSNAELSVYPSPIACGENLLVLLPVGVNVKAEVMIFTLDGKRVYQASIKDLYGHQLILNIPTEFAAGTYILRVNSEVARFIVE